MYNDKVVCTYNIAECDMQEIMYRRDLLSVFNLDEFSDEKINSSIDELYENLKNCEILQDCMKKAANIMLSEDLETGIRILFSYDYFHLFHACIFSYLNNDKQFDNHVRVLQRKLSR